MKNPLRAVPVKPAPAGAAEHLFDSKPIDPVVARRLEAELYEQWKSRTIESAIKIAAQDEGVRIRLRKEMERLGTGKRGKPNPIALRAEMLKTNFEIAEKLLKVGRGPMYTPEPRDCAEFLISKTKLYPKANTPGALLKRQRRYDKSKP